jgi:PAS domain S-box-containing protein
MAVSTCLGSSFPIVIWWGRDLILLYNDPYTSILGNKHPQALGQRGEECWREVWPLVGPMLERVLDHGMPFTADDLQLLVWRHGYFEECYFCFSYSPIYEEDGSVSGVFCPVIETTDKIVGARRLETLRELAALGRAETIRGACQQAIAVLAKNGRDVPFAYLYLLSEDGKSATLMAATDSSAEGAELRLAQFTEWPLRSAFDGPLVLEDLAGKHLPTGGWSEPTRQAFLAPVVLPGNFRVRAVFVAGLSPHKRLDQSYRSFLELLVAQVGSTIADTLAYEAERQRAEALAELDRAKTLFFSNISHEFRTPLTLMLGPLEELLSGSGLSAAEHDRLNIAHRSALRLLKLVNSLLDFSRIEAGRVQASYEPTDLAALTIDLSSNFRSVCEAAGLSLVVNCPSLNQPVYVDREMWEKIVLNLVSNAFKFTLEGAIRIELRRENGFAVLEVRDTGIGIAEAELPRIFERFHRIENARGRAHEGSGIGLALVRELVGLSGGTVEVASTLAQGSSFTVRLPFGHAHLAADRIAAPRTLASTATRAEAFVGEALRWLPDREPADTIEAMFGPDPFMPGPDEGGLVLVVDDNADMRDYLRQLLAGRYEVEAAADGQQALEAIDRRRPDLVLSDVMMPRLDGFGLLKALRARTDTKQLPVILLSARAGEEAKVEGLESGADDYLIKPFSARELLARTAANIKMARVRRHASEAVRESEERLLNAIEVGRLGVWDWNIPSGEIHWSDEHFRMGGYAVGEVTPSYEAWASRIHPDDRAAAEAVLRAALETHSEYIREFRVVHPDGSVHWLYARGRFFYDNQARPIRMIGAMIDTTERRALEDRQRVLVAELQHRTRNLLAVVRSMADKTASNSTNLGDFRGRFRDRLGAMTRVQGLLSRLNEHDQVTFNDLIHSEMVAVDGGDRVSLSGPKGVRLRSSTVQVLAMALHELATNAVKYGALSQPSARLVVTWSLEPRGEGGKSWLHIDWREHGVEMSPGSKPRGGGQGRELIEQALPYQLSAKTSFELGLDGIHCTISMPLSANQQAANAHG